MTIQPSIMVWTVICFLLLTVILKNLLFEPVLKVMDSRRQKIEAARTKKASVEKMVAEHKLQAEKDKLLAEEEGKRLAKQKIEQIQLHSKEEIEAAQSQCLVEIQQYKEDIINEYENIVSSVAPKMETAAALLAKNIISHRI